MPSSQPILFFRRFLASPIAVGALFPTSRATARIMASPIPKGGAVLELGAGTGTITEGIMERIRDTNRLTAVEVDAELANGFKKNFPFVNLIVADAEEVLQKKTAYDAIVSGIPFAVMAPEKRERILNLIAERLKPSGTFVAIQYSLSSLKELKRHFPRVHVRVSPLNLPPAVVYVCDRG